MDHVCMYALYQKKIDMKRDYLYKSDKFELVENKNSQAGL